VEVFTRGLARQLLPLRRHLSPKQPVWIDLLDRVFDGQAALHRRRCDTRSHWSEVPRHDEPGSGHQRVGDDRDEQQAEGLT
jgi:hypothetical protein